LPNFRRDLTSHGDHVGSGDGHSVAPNRAVVRDIHRFQSDLKLVALFHIVAGDDVGHMHGLAGFLQVERRRIVLAGRGKWANGKGAHVTERGCDFVGQSQPQKIYILVGTQIL